MSVARGSRVLLALELVLGVAPLTAFYVYLFPAGVFWARNAVRAALGGSPNAYALGMAAAFVLGGLGLVSLWLSVGGRLLGRVTVGRLVMTGIVAGMAASVFLLTTTTILGAYWTDYFFYGTPLLVAGRQIMLIARSRHRVGKTVAPAA